MTPPPANPKLYHIVHMDRLPSILADGRLLCDAVMAERPGTGTTIGMGKINDATTQYNRTKSMSGITPDQQDLLTTLANKL